MAVLAQHVVHHVIAEMTSFCNIDCSYCYLPSRNKNNRMSPDIATLLAERVCAFPDVNRPLIWTWHAGEPMSVGLPWFRRCHDAVAGVLTARRIPVQFSIQTNATLIDDAWVAFFKENDYRVSVSFDGTRVLHDRNRVTRNGTGTYDKVTKGIDALTGGGLTLSAICLLSADSLEHGTAIIHEFGQLGITYIGFNFEEVEGINTRSSFAALTRAELYSAVSRFVIDVINTRDRHYPNLVIREIDALMDLIRGQHDVRSFVSDPFRYLTCTHIGDVYTFCPELVGHRRIDGSSFAVGNIGDCDLTTMLQRVLSGQDFQDIEAGITMCREACEYFATCGGGLPSNKFFENKSFATTETMHCRVRFQSWVDAVVDYVIDSAGANASGSVRSRHTVA